jgi:hypothetical protein
MGNDSGIRRKHKQRTVLHKKHSAFPGITLSKDVKIEAGSIRLKNPRPQLAQANTRTVSNSDDPRWAAYYEASAKLLDQMISNKSSAPLGGRRNIEARYAYTYRQLARDGLVYRIKAKYWR